MSSGGENVYLLYHEELALNGATMSVERLFLILFFDSNARAGRILSLKMLLDRGSHANYPVKFY